jgi:hypothetical protein
VVNDEPELSGIRVGLHDQIFQGATPVLAGVDAQSTYCYLLVAEQHRDADTWGVHLLDAAERGLRPDYTIADAGRGLRAGQQAAWDDTPCHGDVFHIQRRCDGLAHTLSRLAMGATSRRKTLQAGIDRAGQRDADHELVVQLEQARRTEARALCLARDVRTLVHWLRHDVLALAGPNLATRRELFNFVVTELMAREPEDPRRIRPVRVALQNQRDGVVQNRPVLGHTGARRAPACEGRMSTTFDVPCAGGGQPPTVSSPLGLKRSQAQQGEPVRMALAGHQLPRALALALGVPAAQEAAVVQEEPQQVQV